ncbi:ABC transporter substrate-binding protein [Acetonema longum]|uniref:Periplasmic binding protein n=1 Tax=Acetonema longum DSM 6540 TaxID=1009370 RepID=F7NHH6_9FIRM|nr:ABC transporter substrate-binding protein [Acetonema longum]EGO64523.1 periplasmic binding protein [Acetonema longum DSM 6540]
MLNKWIVGVVAVLLLGGSLWSLTRDGAERTAGKTVARTVTDSAGRQLVIPERPQRVVALNASHVDLYTSAGGHLTGRAATETLPPAVKTAVQDVPQVGVPNNPSLEKILALKPDLILGANIPFHQELLPVLTQAGIPVYLRNPDTPEDVLSILRLYGELAGTPGKANSLATQIESRMQAAIEGSKGKTSPRTLLLWGTTESFSMILSGTFTGDLMKRLGGDNVADQAEKSGPMAGSGYVPLSLEFVSKANPEVILFITHSADDKVEAKFRAELAAHPAWKGMKAVKENRVHKLPYHLFAINPGTRMAEATDVLAGLLYADSVMQ